MTLPVYRSRPTCPDAPAIDAELVSKWLVRFLRDEVIRSRGVDRAVLGLSGGIDSAVVAFLCAEAFGSRNTHVLRMPYRLSSRESLDHADLVVRALGLDARTIDITAMVDGYAETDPEMSPTRLGNVCARARMIVLFDQSARLGALPIGTGNKSERLLGYFTWHADDSPPINPLGDLFKTQVVALARYLGVPSVIIDKPPTADLVKGQTDEGDFGISYARADGILHHLTLGRTRESIAALGYTAEEIALVTTRLEGTHWKRRLPTVAMLSDSAIGEFYLRPVDY
jgi:NAD+ synthase